jgi:hypothetical protein
LGLPGLHEGYFFAPALRRSAQYFRIRSAAAFLAAGDMPRRFRGARVAAPLAGAASFGADPLLLADLIFAHRAFWAAAIAARPAADNFPRLRG